MNPEDVTALTDAIDALEHAAAAAAALRGRLGLALVACWVLGRLARAAWAYGVVRARYRHVGRRGHLTRAEARQLVESETAARTACRPPPPRRTGPRGSGIGPGPLE